MTSTALFAPPARTASAGDTESAGAAVPAATTARALAGHAVPDRGHRRSSVADVRTVPNLITVARTVVAVPIALHAVATSSTVLLLTAYLIYWVGDILDGWSARRLGQETRLGAVLDITCDRVSTCLLVGALMVRDPALWPALTVFLLQFMVLDQLLSLAFLRWPLVSPTYFYRVDRTVWRWNWSPPAKALNTAGVVLAAATGSLPIALAVAIPVLGVKAWSAWRVLSIATAPGVPATSEVPAAAEVSAASGAPAAAPLLAAEVSAAATPVVHRAGGQ
ncbi:MAG: CDP-alcohol phosphatidyltransferase family protein [Angustibacter sp.]